MINRIALLLVVACLGPAAAVSAKQFEPDVHTLLLASFDEQTTRADYAMGLSEFAGNGATLTAGYYGQAIDLRARGLTEDFWNRSAERSPRADGWGFHSRGNVSPWQGTLECWFQPADPRARRILWVANFFNADQARVVPDPDNEDRYTQQAMFLHRFGLRYCYPTVAGHAFKGEMKFQDIEGFGKSLATNEWHHFAMTWSAGALVVYLDGRALLAFDMTDELGLAFVANPSLFINVTDCVIDELRISDVVRYTADFEPAWHDSVRPAYAFTGNPAVPAYRHRERPPPQPTLPKAPRGARVAHYRFGEYTLGIDRRTGALVDFRIGRRRGPTGHHGLLLRAGVERRPLAARGATEFIHQDQQLRFTQLFENQVRARHQLRESGGVLHWEIDLRNEGDKEIWLEPLLSVPVTLAEATEFFDGVEPRTALALPRHHDEYACTLPFVAAAGADAFVGLGIDPRIDLSEIINEWIPDRRTGVIRLGTKVALAPGESFAYRFLAVHGEGAFATLDAIQAYHDQFPTLYRLLPDVPVYSYMPATQYYNADKQVEIKRLGYAGGFWGHGPGHDKGDEFGRTDWWMNEAFVGQPGYRDAYTRRIERMWGSPRMLREYITDFHRQSYDNFYPVRRYHTCPDVTPVYIANALWPGYVANEDPLCFGQYYRPTWEWWIVNEYNTPIGAHFRETTRQFFRQTKGTCPGFINDMSHAGSLYRHNDPIAKATPGRAFAPDLGTFVRKALGRKQRYQVLNSFVDDGHRATFWSDGGAFSYTLCAYSAGVAIEGGALYRGLTGPGQYTVPARNLLGEKPLTAMTHLNDDWIGYYLDPAAFTPATLRDYYRFCGSQLVLFCLERGITLDPGSYMSGRQHELELAPIMVESTVLGRQVVHGATVPPPLWVRRAGHDLGTLLVVGNQSPAAVDTDVTVYRQYFGGAPLFAEYYGAPTPQRLDRDTTRITGVTVPARDVAAFKAIALLDTRDDAEVTARLAGDGLVVQLELDLTVRPGSEIRLADLGPLYEIDAVHLNGQSVTQDWDVPVPLDARQNRIQVRYRNRALAFTAAQWAAVELIKDGKVNFCLVADRGVRFTPDPARPHTTFLLGFERGTANLLNDFLDMYDDEDGIPGNLGQAEFHAEVPADYAGWSVVLQEDPLVVSGRVRIDGETRTITVEGPTQGDLRRAMTVFLRLVDRKYPHVGRFFPFRYRKHLYQAGEPVPIEKWVLRRPTQQFFQAFADQQFLLKPILRREYEPLYADGNLDFAGKYRMKWGSYIYEPTYADDFVHGYSGRGTAPTYEELTKTAPPLEK